MNQNTDRSRVEPSKVKSRSVAASLSNTDASVKRTSPVQRKVNNTGLPNQLKSGIENLSGHSMDDVKVHYNSSKPAQLNAHAYAQGNQIHLGPGQQKHLPHEVWHVVQQKQGRVKPTMQMKSKVNINDDVGLEKEADVMGEKAIQTKGNIQYDALKNNPLSQSYDSPLQAKWLYQGYYDKAHKYYKWNKLLDGAIQWYAIAGTDLMYYEIKNHGALPVGSPYLHQSGFEHRKSHNKWISDHMFNWNPDTHYSAKDLAVENHSLEPDMPMHHVKHHFAEAAAHALSEHDPPDYIKGIVKASGDMYSLPPEGVRKEMNKLVHLHETAKAHLAKHGVSVLARFHVHDENVGKVHPGINSWAHLKGHTPMSEPEVTRTATSHMKFGHDVDGAGDIVRHSPLISATSSIGHLMLADSQYNNKIQSSIMASSGEMTAVGDKSKKPTGGKYYSQRIDHLLYGTGNAKVDKALKLHIANRISFLAINSKAKVPHVFGPTDVGGTPVDCCTLEHEHTVFSPHQDLSELEAGSVENPLPELKPAMKATSTDTALSAVGPSGGAAAGVFGAMASPSRRTASPMVAGRSSRTSLFRTMHKGSLGTVKEKSESKESKESKDE